MALPKMVQHRSKAPSASRPTAASDFRSQIPRHGLNQLPKSRVPLYAGGALVYSLAVYAGYRYFAKEDDAKVATTPKDTLALSRPDVYDQIASRYDADIGFDETLMGLNWIRWWLCRQARGDVLEASCGTGRNTSYYKLPLLNSITFVDQSSEMIELCKAKWQAQQCSDSKIPVTFKDQPLEGLSPNRDQYDTIVQTFGLCSVADPSGYLSHLSSFLRPTGEMLLLEHGRSKYALINRILDRSVDQHADKWGCFYNRDIQAIVDACPELEVVSSRRLHFGTTYMLHLKHRQNKAAEAMAS